jgi:hypothetical protein
MLYPIIDRMLYCVSSVIGVLLSRTAFPAPWLAKVVLGVDQLFDCQSVLMRRPRCVRVRKEAESRTVREDGLSQESVLHGRTHETSSHG